MRYLKSVLVGLFTALFAIVVVILALVRVSYGDGSSTVSVSVSEWHTLTAGLIGFVAGFWWTLRRGRRIRDT